LAEAIKGWQGREISRRAWIASSRARVLRTTQLLLASREGALRMMTLLGEPVSARVGVTSSITSEMWLAR
jgi:hypothetical protein